jgi:hypothetical protein
MTEFTRHELLDPEDTAALEDWLWERRVFLNGLRGTPAHPDSWMTVVDPPALTAALDELEQKHRPTPEEWQSIARKILDNPNQGPPMRLVACELEMRAVRGSCEADDH